MIVKNVHIRQIWKAGPLCLVNTSSVSSTYRSAWAHSNNGPQLLPSKQAKRDSTKGPCLWCLALSREEDLPSELRLPTGLGTALQPAPKSSYKVNRASFLLSCWIWLHLTCSLGRAASFRRDPGMSSVFWHFYNVVLMMLTPKILFRRGLLPRFIKRKNNDCIAAFFFFFLWSCRMVFRYGDNGGNISLQFPANDHWGADDAPRCPRNKASF